MSAARTITTIALALLLSACATGRELQGDWYLAVGRSGACRVVMHAAKTDQLETRTVWRGEQCAPAPTLPPAPDMKTAQSPAP